MEVIKLLLLQDIGGQMPSLLHSYPATLRELVWDPRLKTITPLGIVTLDTVAFSVLNANQAMFVILTSSVLPVLPKSITSSF